MQILKTKEPLLIWSEYPDDDNYYVLPQGVKLHYVSGMAEGHQLYMAYFYHKGAIEHEEVPMKLEYFGNFTAPIWLANIDSDILKEIFKRFPISKSNVIDAIRANELTRTDLVEIVRSLPK